jgi:hypothetical protein
MPNMHSEWLRQLPYLVHTNRELGLMLRGYKPLAYFMDVIGQEPEICIRYWRMFDGYVAAGRLKKCEVVEPIPDLPQLSNIGSYSTPCLATSGGLMPCLRS